MTEPAFWTHDQVDRRVHAAMTAAMRADVHSIDAALVQQGRLDPHSCEFVAQSRRLVLACTAALTCVLSVHHPGGGRRGRQFCQGCGTLDCRTLHGVADVLAAYSVRPAPVDRAEAWRRADAHFARGGRPVPLIVEEFPDGFIARAATNPSGDPHPVVVVDRHTGALSRWPAMPYDVLIREYTDYRAAN
ncbi:hypothetical protein [Actinomadura bangladeshensis]|uniref:Uncharacterized protein n=1 Tax=Actinomadura bangladeshensis TaxID=453573 RepID=A0A6L9QI24_9ACTN|nr:hypothetical protein [Actinomadura bangladeshensis]NEA24762.1 hypothetical protein [Actinomadura bangladeshensis]